jgi:hypothetical protein
MAPGDVIINIPDEYTVPNTSMSQRGYTFGYGLVGLGGAIANTLQPYVNLGVQTLTKVSSPYVPSTTTNIKTTTADIGNLVYDISGNVIDKVYTLPQTIGLKTGFLRKKQYIKNDIEAQNEWCVLNDVGELIILESNIVSIRIEG